MEGESVLVNLMQLGAPKAASACSQGSYKVVVAGASVAISQGPDWHCVGLICLTNVPSQIKRERGRERERERERERKREILVQCKVLLLRWMSNLSYGHGYQLFDVFSGAGNVGETWLPLLIYMC